MISWTHICGGTALSALVLAAPAAAQTCTPLAVVGGTDTVVEKVVSPPGTLITQDNWNTDFIVPSGSRFSNFIVTVTSLAGDTYDIDVNLKYSDETVDQPFSVRNEILVENDPLVVEAAPRVGEQPYQINVRVGGLEAVENEYRASVMGCR